MISSCIIPEVVVVVSQEHDPELADGKGTSSDVGEKDDAPPTTNDPLLSDSTSITAGGTPSLIREV